MLKMEDVWLKDNINNRYVLANLTGFERRHIEMWYNQWKDNLKKRDNSLYPAARWDWEEIFSSMLSDVTRKGFCIEYQDRLQGILVVTYKGKMNRDGEPIVFVEYIATAPWNRPDNILTKNKGQFSLIGSYLLRCAVDLSQTLGYEGRIALESEPEAMEFYEQVGMENKGATDAEYAYFEFNKNNALSFIKQLEMEIRRIKGINDKH